MFQSFEEITDKSRGPERLEALREAMREAGIDVYLVPHSDEYQNEYLPAGAERLAWLTGFTGSAGFAVITHREAVIFVDGRYTLQVREQADPDHFTPESLIDLPPDKWLEKNLEENAVIGFDPWLITLSEHQRFEKAVQSRGGTLQPTDNLVDQLWTDQPTVPIGKVAIHELQHAGKLARDKIADLRKELENANADCCLITDPTSICWLFNIRGADVPHTPLTLSRCILRAEGHPLLFIDKRKLPRETEAYLTQLADLHPPGRLDEELAALSRDARIRVDPNGVPVFLSQIVEASAGKLLKERDPVVLPRAVKNPVEIEGARKAHLRDGLAFAKFLCWLDRQAPGSQTEISVATRLEETRAETVRILSNEIASEMVDIAFDTISGAGGNSAIPHYRVSTQSNRPLSENSIYLVDSGAQYRDGTTDITRTLPVGTPLEAAIRDFTLVLRGHINIALARFPKGTRGMDIDVLARNALWQDGKDFNHGTGHGVGSYLSVHEGPQRIARTGTQELLPGMIVSNEPGYYVPGQYGIRIENLVLVRELEEISGGNTPVHGFETLTMAPIDLRLVDPTLMTDAELHWLNAYHGWVNRKLAPHLEDAEKDWLRQATRPVSRELPAASA